MKEILKLDHIQKYYGSEGGITRAIRDISFTVEEGEFLGIMGASGSGKTTLLNCISTIDTVSAGHIYLDGEDVTEIRPKALARFRREKLGFVFQDFNLLDTLTIGENIALVLSINHTPPAEVEPRVEEMARRLNIQDILHKYPYQVSRTSCTSTLTRCRAGSGSAVPAPGPSSTLRGSCWPTSPPARWTATRPRCCSTPSRASTPGSGPPS